jgi:hypothetical protein
MEELHQVEIQMMSDLDKSISNIAISNQADRKKYIDQYTAALTESEIIGKNRNVVNEELSNSTGFIVDGNGENKFDAN